MGGLLNQGSKAGGGAELTQRRGGRSRGVATTQMEKEETGSESADLEPSRAGVAVCDEAASHQSRQPLGQGGPCPGMGLPVGSGWAARGELLTFFCSGGIL